MTMHHERVHGEHAILTTVFFGGLRRRAHRRLAVLSGARSGDRVLDVGCGTGYFTRMLAAAVAPDGLAHGVDPSGEAVAKAKAQNRLPNCTFAPGDAQRLDAADGSYDVVVTTLTMHHFPEPERALAEMYRVLRPGGSLLVAEFRPPRSRLARRLVSRHSPAMAEIRVDVIEPLVRGAGFAVGPTGDLRARIRYVLAHRPA